METKNREEVDQLEQNQVSGVKSEKGIEVDVPSSTVVLYTDSAFITTNEFGCVIDFAQRLGSTNRHNIVARVGMSKSHMQALIKALQDRLEDKKVIEVTKRVES